MPKRILYFDDNANLGQGGGEIVQQGEIEWHVVRDIETAIARLKTQTYDLILADVMLPPGQDGRLETDHGWRTGVDVFHKLIRKWLPATPVVLLTSFNNPDLHRAIHSLGKTTVLTKPVRLDDIAGTIETLIADSCENLYDYGPSDKKHAEIICVELASVNHTCLEYLSRHPEEIYSLTPRRFEELIARILEDLGYETTLTPPTRDGGVDIYAAKRDDLGEWLYVAECKRYSPEHPVGVHHIRSLYGVKNIVNATGAILVTSSFFTGPAKAFQESRRHEIALEDYSTLKKWLSRYRRA